MLLEWLCRLSQLHASVLKLKIRTCYKGQSEFVSIILQGKKMKVRYIYLLRVTCQGGAWWCGMRCRLSHHGFNFAVMREIEGSVQPGRWFLGFIDDMPVNKKHFLKQSNEGLICFDLMQYLSNSALANTSVASTTVLTSTSGLFTLFFGALLGQDSINLTKIVAVFISMAGVAMTTFGKTWTPRELMSISE